MVGNQARWATTSIFHGICLKFLHLQRIFYSDKLTHLFIMQMHTGFRCETLKERDNLENQGVNGVLKRTLKQDGMTRTSKSRGSCENCNKNFLDGTECRHVLGLAANCASFLVRDSANRNWVRHEATAAAVAAASIQSELACFFIRQPTTRSAWPSCTLH